MIKIVWSSLLYMQQNCAAISRGARTQSMGGPSQISALALITTYQLTFDSKVISGVQNIRCHPSTIGNQCAKIELNTQEKVCVIDQMDRFKGFLCNYFCFYLTFHSNYISSKQTLCCQPTNRCAKNEPPTSCKKSLSF